MIDITGFNRPFARTEHDFSLPKPVKGSDGHVTETG